MWMNLILTPIDIDQVTRLDACSRHFIDLNQSLVNTMVPNLFVEIRN